MYGISRNQIRKYNLAAQTCESYSLMAIVEFQIGAGQFDATIAQRLAKLPKTYQGDGALALWTKWTKEK
jgi:hypothetical protein